jgi:hypothetical protein
MIDAGSSSDLAFDGGLESSSTTGVDSDQAIAMEEHDRKTKGAPTQIRTREPPTSIQKAEVGHIPINTLNALLTMI